MISSASRSSIFVNSSWLLSGMLKLTNTGLLHLRESRPASVEDETDVTSPISWVDVGDFWYAVDIANDSSLNTGSLSRPTQIISWSFIFSIWKHMGLSNTVPVNWWTPMGDILSLLFKGNTVLTDMFQYHFKIGSSKMWMYTTVYSCWQCVLCGSNSFSKWQAMPTTCFTLFSLGGSLYVVIQNASERRFWVLMSSAELSGFRQLELKFSQVTTWILST